jgi:hypothetical protein
MRVAIVLTLVLAVAGCLTDAGPEADPASTQAPDVDDTTRQAQQASVAPNATSGWAERALPDGPDHDHMDAGDHRQRSTPNMQVRGYDPLVTDHHDATSGDYYCGGKAELDDKTITVTHSFETDVALVVVDVSDPANPEKIGELALPNTHVWDVSVTDDGSYAILGVTPNEVPPEEDGSAEAVPSEPGHGHSHGEAEDEVQVDWDDPRLSPAAQRLGPDDVGQTSLQPVWRDACGNEFQGPETEVPYLAGGVLVDLRDLTSPEVADFVPQPLLGGHSVVANTVDGQHHVMVATTNLQHQTSYFSFYTIEEVGPMGDLQPRLTPFGTFSSAYPVPESPDQVPTINGHVDGWIQKHPETGELLAHLANHNGGYLVVHLAERGVIEPVGTWNDYDRQAPYGQTGAIHTARPLEGTREGRHLTIVGQELVTRAEHRPTGEMIVMDTTDPADPQPVARWTFPADVDWNGTLMFSTHYVAPDGERLFVSSWHGGVWATNVSEEHWPELPTTGVFLPGMESPEAPPPHLGAYIPYQPIVPDVFALGDGTFAAFDGPSGVYVVDHERTGEVPVPEPWTEDAWIGEAPG